jgi:predicted aminopeptidase
MSRSKILKRTGLGVITLLLALLLIYWDLVSYGYRQAKGQLTIVWNAKPISELLNDPVFPDSLKAKLHFIEKVRRYAIDSLGLQDTDNYKTVYDQRGEEVMWVVTASERYALVPKEWVFPILGAVPYKGFFNKERALNEKNQLEQAGWDVSVRNPGGWSTLGWFTDPILSKMLERAEGDLASLIIHEMVHATLFVKDSVDFNENLASFIGDRGAEKFLIATYGDTSLHYRAFVTEDMDYRQYVDHILRACDFLDSVYASIQQFSEDEKVIQKEIAITQVVEAMDTLTFNSLESPANRFQDQLPNNAYFLSFRRYQSRQEVFWEQWQNQFNGDLRAYIRWLSEQYPSL